MLLVIFPNILTNLSIDGGVGGKNIFHFSGFGKKLGHCPANKFEGQNKIGNKLKQSLKNTKRTNLFTNDTNEKIPRYSSDVSLGLFEGIELISQILAQLDLKGKTSQSPVVSDEKENYQINNKHNIVS